MKKEEFDLSEKLFRWKLKHSKRMVIDGSERYWYLAIQELDKDIKEAARRLKEDACRIKCSEFERVKFIQKLNQNFGDKLI